MRALRGLGLGNDRGAVGGDCDAPLSQRITGRRGEASRFAQVGCPVFEALAKSLLGVGDVLASDCRVLRGKRGERRVA